MDIRTTWPALLGALTRGESLTADETEWAMGEIMEGAATSAQIAGFAIALRMKGASVAELSGLARAMLSHATPIHVSGHVVDLVGTGGDGARTVNVSTMATMVAAAAGARMVKHGNRAASSACGAADVLEALGVVIDLPPAASAELASSLGIAFLFAAMYHPALRHAGPTRSQLGVPTVFNNLGPLTNPARPSALAVGVADPRMASVIAGVLAERGCSALVFRGEDGLDELTTTGPSTLWVVHGGEVAQTTFDPAVLGLAGSSLDDLRGGDAAFNAGVVRSVLAGAPGPVRDIVLLNAAAALAAGIGTNTLYEALLTLVHSYAHRLIRLTAVHAGIERNSLSELLVPLHQGFFLYAAARGDFVLGGLQAVFEGELHALLREFVHGEHRCALDPGCTRGGGACVACLHLGEPSCRFFNTQLNRASLFGISGYLGETEIM